MKPLTKLFLISLSWFLVACEGQSEYFRLDGQTMGTTYQVTLELKHGDAEKLHDAIDDKLIEINQQMSTYIDDSELSLFNQSTSTDCQRLSPQTLTVIRSAVEVSRWTEGKFDVTLAPLIEVWGFDKKETHDIIPSQQVIDELRNQFGYDKISIEVDCVAKQLPTLSINLSAIAKGYAVDEIASLVASAGSRNYLVEIGGEIANQGVNAKGKPWRIAIESAASAERSIQRTLTPNGKGMATSGSYRNYFEKDGKRFSHTIDPTTGYPITHNLASVTVLHAQTMIADAIATAMMVMGPEASLKFANERQLPIFMLVKQDEAFVEIYSDAFAAYLQ